MQRILALIVLVVLFVGGFYYYSDYKKSLQDPLSRYQKIASLTEVKQAAAYQKTISAWVKDPASQIPYPKGWQKVSVTNQGYTFDVVTSDTATPPQYYVSFEFPKKLIPKMNLIKCLGWSSEEKTTDICVVGDNPAVNAYFNMVEWFKKFSADQMENMKAFSSSLPEEKE